MVGRSVARRMDPRRRAAYLRQPVLTHTPASGWMRLNFERAAIEVGTIESMVGGSIARRPTTRGPTFGHHLSLLGAIGRIRQTNLAASSASALSPLR